MRIYSIINSEIFDYRNNNHPLRQAAFIQLAICLRDVAFKCENNGKRINFTDDVIQTNTIKDVSDLIKFCRDACCHIDSNNHKFDSGGTFSFNTLYGNTEFAGVINPYDDDDVCFCFGGQKIFLKRHINRFLDEAVSWLKTQMSLLPAEWEVIFRVRHIIN
jgi:hypothetical protein